MTVADLYQGFVAGGMRTAAAVIAIPILVGGVALLLRGSGNPRASQAVANFGVVLGFVAVSIEILAVLYAVQELDVDLLSDVDLVVLLAPVYLLAAGFLVEHLIHPGEQESVRQRLRSAVLIIIALAVLYFLLGRLRLYMVIFTSITGFLFFVAVLIGILYFVVRKVL